MFDFCLDELSVFQKYVMEFVDYWVRAEKTPVPLREIKKHMLTQGVKGYSSVDAVNALLKKGYIRRAVGTSKNRSAYVQLRRI